MLQTLRRAGGSLVMTVPKAFVEQNALGEGSKVMLALRGNQMTVKTVERPKYKLADLLAEMTEAAPLVDGWDQMPDVGREID